MWLVWTVEQVTSSAPIKAKNKPALKERDRERERAGREMWRWADEGREKRSKRGRGWCLKHKTEAGKRRWGNNEAREEWGRSVSHRENVLIWRAAAAAAVARLHLRRQHKWRATDKHSRCQVLTPARWPCTLINCLETESLRSHFSHALLRHMKYIKLLFRAATSPIDPCRVLTSAQGSQEWCTERKEKNVGALASLSSFSLNNNFC